MVQGDLREVDLSDATVVVMYLLPEAIAGITETHLLPLLRRGSPIPPRQSSPPEDLEKQLQDNRDSAVKAVELEGGAIGDDKLVQTSSNEGGVGGGSLKPCRIVCNTWGIPGATAVREAGVGMYGGCKLRLFTSASLPTANT